MERRHDLDALRAFAMLLGIALHSALSFTGGPWLVQDARTSGFLGLLVMAVHGFRMPLFFLLSGFFTAMLWRRKGLRALVSHRLRRVLLPLLLGMVTVIPAMHWATSAATGGEGRATPAQRSGAPDQPPSIWRASAEGDAELAARLLDEGASLDAPDPVFGVTPLSYATLFGHAEIVRLLLGRGADARADNRDGGTALHTAAFLGRSEIARMLLDAGADPTVKNERGETARQAAMTDWRTTQFIARTIRVPVEEEMLRQGREEILTLLDDDGETPAKARPLIGVWLFLTRVPVFHHLWFLWFLCWMVAGFSLCAWVASRVGFVAKARSWVATPLRYVWLLPLTFLPAWFMGRVMPNFGPDTSTALLPPLHLLVYYGIFFGFGALYFDSASAGKDSMGRRWWLTLPLALLLFPAGMLAVFSGGAAWRPVAIAIQVLYVWAMCAAMMGFFRRFVSGERKWVRYLSDASYWMYLAHLPLVLLAQGWVSDWAMPAVLKFLLVCAGVSAILLISYHYLVRYTWVGALLNGRKSKRSPGL